MTRKSRIQALLIAFVAFGIIIYWATGYSANDDNENKKSSVLNWYSSSPTNILSEEDAQVDINNIRTLQDAGWKLLMQDSHPVSFNKDVNGRNEIIEKSAQNLFNGCYELHINSKGEILDIKPSNKAKKIFKDNQEVDY
ncbi:hypothetical protein CN383_26860 [Priestia megaterium]|uniref:hypothetical protein n=1 Tax=Priestia megaterium TaxID=1404 RepID=UPI000BF2E325|nr:hypothetical protein [Priestia megaterium]PFA94138.1 hypothetical protein CN383_26860 [Priestia megaterium]